MPENEVKTAEIVPREPPRMRQVPRKPVPYVPDSVDEGFQDAEKTFLAATGKKMTKRKGRYPYPTERELVKALRMNNVDYFRAILSDQAEMDLWMRFMHGKQPMRDAEGKLLLDEQHRVIMEDVETNPIQLKAFLRAVEYKRGAPVNIDPAAQGQNTMKVTFELTGASPEFFMDTGKSSGLIK